MSVFTDTEVNLDNMRICQKEAAEAARLYYTKPHYEERQTLLQLPTGTGKSALIAALPFCVPCTRVLVLVPNLGLVTQMNEDLDVIDHPTKNAYKKYGLLTDEKIEEMEMYTMPLTRHVNRTDISDAHIIVANYHKFQDVERWFGANKDLIDLIIIDEAHHQAAKTYQEVMDFFDEAKIIGLTATPFRSDGKLVPGKNIYTYHFSDAIRMKYIRNIEVNNVSPNEVTLKFTDKDAETYTLDQIVNDMKEQSLFNKQVALSEDCCNSIADLAVTKLLELRGKFPETNHQIIAAAMSIRHARDYIKPAFIRHNLRVGMVSSDPADRDKNDKTIADLKKGKLDVIINVGMLGEGFNQETLGVAAIFRPYKTLSPYIQFVGRVLRKNDPATRCYVVSHMGLNQVKRFEEFKLFDAEDKDFMKKLLDDGGDGSTDVFVSDDDLDDKDTTERVQKAQDEVVVTQSTDMMDVKDVFVAEPELPGALIDQYNKLTPTQRAAFLKTLGLEGGQIETLKPRKIKPHQKRLAKKAGLNEHAKSITTDTLRALNLKPYDRNFNPLHRNFAWVQQRVNREINKRLGIKSAERNKVELSILEQFEQSGSLNAIKTDTVEYFRQKLDAKNEE